MSSKNATARAMQPKPAPHPIRHPRSLLAIEGRGVSVVEGRSSGIAIGAMYSVSRPCSGVHSRPFCLLPANPVRAVGAVFALPDRDTRLDPIDECSTSAKRGVAVGCAGRAHDGRLPKVKRTDSMKHGESRARNLRCKFVDDSPHFCESHRRIRLVLELDHRAPLVLVAHCAQKNTYPPCTGMGDVGDGFVGADSNFAQCDERLMRPNGHHRP